MSYDYIEIFSPTIDDPQMVEDLYQQIEQTFPAVLSSKLVHEICDKPRKRARFQVVKDRLKTQVKQQATFGDEKRNIYLSFCNRLSSRTKPGAPHSQICLFIRRGTDIDFNQLSSTMIYTCEHTNAYWGTFMPGDDLVITRWLLQRDYLLQRLDSGCPGDEMPAHTIQNLLTDYPEISGLPEAIYIHNYIYYARDIRIVREIGWVNYWSPSVCEMNGFPDSKNAFDNDTAQTRTSRGGYLWLLTSTPWRMSERTHRQRLIAAYKRFPNVGMRAT